MTTVLSVPGPSFQTIRISISARLEEVGKLTWSGCVPRRAGVQIEGCVYHVYNRVASGEPVFADPEEAIRFIGRGVRRRLEDPDFARRLDALDRALAESAANGKGSARSR